MHTAPSAWTTNRETPLFVGREHARGLLEGLVGGVHEVGSAAIIRGEAGMGKTALLKHIAGRAAVRTLWIQGVESEAVLPFAAAADLLIPLREFFDELPDVQRDALEISLALTTGTVTNPLAACSAALGVLAAAAGKEPLLVLVDDFQWVDPPSQQLLLFIARRLEADRIVLLLAVRDEPGQPQSPIELPTVYLSGMSRAECDALIQQLGLKVSAQVLQDVVDQTGGNPLAIIETLRAARPEHLASANSGIDRAILSPSLEQTWSAVIADLPEGTRMALLVLAASRSARLGDIGPPLAALGLSLDDLAPAEYRGLVLAAGDEIQLLHPLLRSVILARAPTATRLAAFGALAGATDGHLSAWYLAAATTGPDEGVARTLAAAAQEARGRSGYGASARTWRRAAELTPNPHDRAERLLNAAVDAGIAGQSELAIAWCEEARTLRADPGFLADVEVARGRARGALGQPQAAYQGFVSAAEAVLGSDPRRAAGLFAEAAIVSASGGDCAQSAAVVTRAEQAVPLGQPPPLTVLAMGAGSFLLAGDVSAGRQRLDAAELNLSPEHLVSDQQSVVALAQGRLWCEEFDAAQSLLEVIIDAARTAGAPVALSWALASRSELGWWTGRWAAACADAEESLRWAEELGHTTWIGKSLDSLARLDAGRGDTVLCHQRMERARREVLPWGVECMRVHICAVLGLCTLGSGEHEVAIDHLEQAWDAARGMSLGATNPVPFVGNLIEAHIRAGNRDRAEELLPWLEERAATSGLVYPTVAAARCRGLLSDDLDAATSWYDQARASHERRAMPFERAHTLLCEAETLRRLRRPAAARPLLREALAIFDALGARPWMARAANELAATGARSAPKPKAGPSFDQLAPQEFQTARAVAEGLSNPEAAAALFVSRKTVEAHLTRIYRKLGVRSRTELARLFTEHCQGPETET